MLRQGLGRPKAALVAVTMALTGFASAAAQTEGTPPAAAAQPDAPASAAPVSAAPVSAATPFTPTAPQSPAERAGSHRVLAGHRFEPSSIVDDPFSTTSVGTRFGFLYAHTEGPYLLGGPPAITCCKDAEIGGFGGAFDVSVRAADWLAVRFDVATAVYSGLNRQSIVVAGPGLRLSALAELVAGRDVGERVRVAGLLRVSSEPALNILILSGLLDAAESGDVSGGEILETSNTLLYGAGGTAAWAISRSLGLVATIQYVAPNQVGSVSAFSAAGIVGATELDLDLREVWATVPINLSASYRLTSPIDTDTFRAQHDYRGAVGYTGRPGLSARFELGGRSFHLREDQLFTDALVLDWIVRYDW